MKLLLTSSGLSTEKIKKEFLKLIGRPAKEIKILLIPTAGNLKEDKSYIERDKGDLIRLGILKENLIEYDLDKINENIDFEDIDAIFVEGGNTFYLLKKVRETGFDKKIIDLVKRGVVYIGVSAGSILACPNIETASPFDNNIANLKDLTSLNLTSVIISPHFTNTNENKIKELENKLKYKLIRLTDSQALLIIGNKSKIIK